MRKRVVLTLGKGSWRTGFPTVMAQFWNGSDAAGIQVSGSLPANPDLLAQYQDWRIYYDNISKNSSGFRQNGQGIIFDSEDKSVPQVSSNEFEEKICAQLKEKFNYWLNAGSFTSIDRKLRAQLNPDDDIQFIIGVNDPEVYRFPWNLWTFFEDYSKAEVSVSILDYGKVSSETYSPKRKTRILTVLGDSTGIETSKDKSLLEQLKQVKIVSLIEPKRAEFDRKLWDSEGWDILFFAGHSSSYESGLKGQMQLNSSTILSVSQIRFALKNAIAQGLQLAILNSCDGMGLARELADLSIPQLIVMREPVPDKVAQEFLLHFLEFFAQGEDLYNSVRKARQRLQGLEGTYPCASWLPVICQNPALPSLRLPVRSTTSVKSHLQRLGLAVAVSLISSGLVMGVRSLKLLQNQELIAYDYLMRSSPKEKIDPRITIVTISKEETDTDKYNGQVPDAVLAEAIEKIQQRQPIAIGVDIHRPAAVDPKDPDGYQRLTDLFSQDPDLIGICSNNPDFTNHGPPAGLSRKEIFRKIGFSDLLQDDFDPLQTVRRQGLSFDPKTNPLVTECTASISFSLQLAYRYLYFMENIRPEVEISTGQAQRKFGDVVFSRMNYKFGGYQDLDEGDEILIRYRRAINPAQRTSLEENILPALSLSLSEILVDKFPIDAINEKIILIGYTAPAAKDTFKTPYAEKQAGVFIHAHMVSQIISAVLDGRSLIWVLPQWKLIQWGDAVYVFFCSTGIAVLLLNYREVKYRFFVLLFVLLVLYVLGYISFVYIALWLPLVPSLWAAGITYMFVTLYNLEDGFDKLLSLSDSNS